MKKTSTSQGMTQSFVALFIVLLSGFSWGNAFSQANPNGQACFEGPTVACATCQLRYPDNSNLPRSAVVFNESEVLRAAVPGPSTCGGAPTQIKAYYNDEHAMVLGVRRVIVKTNSSSTTTDYPITPTPTSASCVTNPLVGTTAMSGDQSGNDVAIDGGRPLRPSLFITDLTVNGMSSRNGDWQYGGTAIAPHQICGTWKGAVRTVDKTKNPEVVTVTPDANPPKNDWNLGSQTVPAGLTNQGYGAVVIWNIADLGLIPGHTYRLQFMVHDGDQNKTGGDVGQACTILVMPGSSPAPTTATTAKTVWTTNTAANTITFRTTLSQNFVDNTYGTNANGYGTAGHSFMDLVNSDKLRMALYDGAGSLKMDFNLDYFSASTAVASGYKSLGVEAGDGSMIKGTKGDIVSFKTSMDENFNTNGNVQTTNSSTAASWIKDVWYEVTVKTSAFGSQGFGSIKIPLVHASPSKSGTNELALDGVDCPSGLMKLGNFVYDDRNNNGKSDLGEPGFNGVHINLYLDENNDNIADGAAISSAVTDANGYYQFTNLPAGNYIVGVVLPYNTSLVKTNGGDPDNNIDNDNNGITTSNGEVRAYAITLSPDTEPANDGDGTNGNLSLDFALITNDAEIGDYVWDDLNKNGRQEANEPGMKNIIIKLYTCAGQYVATTATNEAGYFEFTGVPATEAGTGYKLQFPTLSQLPLGYEYTYKNAPGVPTNSNSDANPQTGLTDCITLHAGDDFLDADAGLQMSNTVVPLTLLSFKGKYEDGISKLVWTTSNEQNVDRFQVEHSNDGLNFHQLGAVASKGTSNGSYTYNDKLVYPGTNYYRLKMFDKDGNYKMSDVIMINVGIKGFNITGIFPSPFVDHLTVHLMTEKATTLEVMLVDNVGKQLRKQTVQAIAGVNNISIDNLGSVASGMYFLKVVSGDNVKTVKLLKD